MYKKELTTENFSQGTNKKEFIIIHHTGTKHGTIEGVLNTLTKGRVSCHYVIDYNGDKYKIGSTNQILWHCGISQWNGKNSINKYGIGIEVLGGYLEEFPYIQRVVTKELIQHLMKTFNIPKQNVLRHCDLTHELSHKGILWNGKTKSRKIDISDLFWNNKYKSWLDYQNSL